MKLNRLMAHMANPAVYPSPGLHTNAGPVHTVELCVPARVEVEDDDGGGVDAPEGAHVVVEVPLVGAKGVVAGVGGGPYAENIKMYGRFTLVL